MKPLLTGFLLFISAPSFALNFDVINCSIGPDASYSVLINLKSQRVELWEMAGTGVSYPALATDAITGHSFKRNKLSVKTSSTGQIELVFNGWGSGKWSHHKVLDRHLQYAIDENVNGVAELVECIEWR